MQAQIKRELERPIDIRQSWLQKKGNYQRQRGTLHNEKRVNYSRRHNNPKCAYTKNKSLKYMKQKLIELKGEIEKFTIIRILNVFSIIDKTVRKSAGIQQTQTTLSVKLT